MASQVFVTGGSGFVGRAVISELLSRGVRVRALVHERTLNIAASNLEVVEGDLFDPAALDRGVSGCDAVIHLVGIILEKPNHGVTFERMHVDAVRAVVGAAQRNGATRWIQMSALGSRPAAKSTYHQTKFAAETIVRASALRWTIFRPSLIHGPAGDFMNMEARWVRKSAPPFAFMPYFGAGVLGQRGAGLLQPISVTDVARAFADALERPPTIGQTYEIGGDQRVSWPQMHQIVANAITGRRRWVLPIPAWYARALASAAPAGLLPFNRDQVIMSQENNVCDLGPFEKDFGWRPAPFEQAIGTYAKEL